MIKMIIKECYQPIFSPHCKFNIDGNCKKESFCTYQKEIRSID